jgi:hypothetical protein
MRVSKKHRHNFLDYRSNWCELVERRKETIAKRIFNQGPR